jgi:hypothetical protein
MLTKLVLNILLGLMQIKQQVPHSQYSLRENPKFLQKKKKKNNTLNINLWLIFSIYICYCIPSFAFMSKTIIINHKIVCINYKKSSNTFVKNVSFVNEALGQL